MSRPVTDYEAFERSSPQNRRLLRQEELIVEVTEALSRALNRERITRAELASRLGKTKGFVSQILAGGRNLTLRTIADLADALGCQIRVQVSSVRSATEAALGPPARLAPLRITAPRPALDSMLGFGIARKYAKKAKIARRRSMKRYGRAKPKKS